MLPAKVQLGHEVKTITNQNPFRPARLSALVLLYGAGTMVAQVLILGELPVQTSGAGIAATSESQSWRS